MNRRRNLSEMTVSEIAFEYGVPQHIAAQMKPNTTTITHRGRSVTLTAKPKPPRKRINVKEHTRHLLASSAMRITTVPAKPDDLHHVQLVEIEITGELSKLPSVANSRCLSVTRPGVHSGKKPRAVSQKNPEYEAMLEALTAKFIDARPQGVRIHDTRSSRWLCLVLLSDACARMDSHNTTKAVCDWLQRSVHVVTNDANVDAFPIHKANMPQLFPSIAMRQSTTIMLVPSRFTRAMLCTFISLMKTVLEGKE